MRARRIDNETLSFLRVAVVGMSVLAASKVMRARNYPR
jgi:hypothetical protein